MDRRFIWWQIRTLNHKISIYDVGVGVGVGVVRILVYIALGLRWGSANIGIQSV